MTAKLWWKHLAAPDSTSTWMVEPGAMTLDTHGHVIITGRASATVDFEADAKLIGAPRQALFVAKYDADGTLMWAKQFGRSLTYGSRVTGVVAGTDDAIVITGHFEGGPLSFGGADLVNAGAYDMFAAKLDAAGEHVWSFRAGGSAVDLGGQAAIDRAGRAVVAAIVDSHLALFWVSTNGEVVLHKQTPGTITISTSVTPIAGVAVDAAGNAVVAGTFKPSSTDFGGGPTSTSGYDAGFVASYAGSDGALRWIRAFTTKTGYPITNEGVLTTGVVSREGCVIVTGRFPTDIDWGGSSAKGPPTG